MSLFRLLGAAWIWIGAVLLYSFFWLWHGGFSSPLSKAEVEVYVSKVRSLRPNLSAKQLQRFRTLLENDDGGPIYMFNAIKLHEKPLDLRGFEGKQTSREILSKYSKFVMSYLIKRGGHPVFAGRATQESVELWGLEKGRKWTMGAIIRYPNRRVLADMFVHPEFQKLHKYKRVSIEKTFAFPTKKVFLFGGARLVFALLLFGLASFLHLLICLRRLARRTDNPHLFVSFVLFFGALLESKRANARAHPYWFS